MKLSEQIDGFFDIQLDAWDEAAERYRALGDVKVRIINIGDRDVRVMYNPARAVSTSAKVDTAAISNRPCFLCSANRPKAQRTIQWRDYDVLVNPFPIFHKHLTIAAREHKPQSIIGYIDDFLALAEELQGYIVFYNGPRCGASAPDHLHFQAVPDFELHFRENIIGSGAVMVCGHSISVVAAQMREIIGQLPSAPGEEPMINVLAYYADNQWCVGIYPRSNHRPKNYTSDIADTSGFMISPGAIDMAGVIITPRLCDFERLDAEIIKDIYTQVSLPHSFVPKIEVGIMNAPEVKVTTVGNVLREENPVTYTAQAPDGRITVHDVIIGIDFHWQRKENQSFEGSIILMPASGSTEVINLIDVERYLLSVVSSEMNSNAYGEFIKAHAIISRSWLMAQIFPDHSLSGYKCVEHEAETVRWYDHDAHTQFHVCADDHCQRYQGIVKASSAHVADAVKATSGLVLTHHGRLCDARFSKCCGGVTELFSTCWQPVDYAYLQPVTDPYCASPGADVLATVLNDYDLETTDFYRWKVTYSADELAEIIRSRSGRDFGKILSIVPLHRGPSGRIDRLEIIGTNQRRIIGKELEIRRTLSRSHLYSSAFEVESEGKDAHGVPQRWIFRGSGWGHGVGLCQIGAAAMAAEGYTYTEILSHYFPGTKLTRIY
ncbi:MAG: DUF4922 domain-containing protein [Paramuribaculum sp.]|nr:DUF4922 domain-containing protein [Paramuribaculum sp.]